MFTYKGVEVNYKVSGRSAKTVVFLHGWGGSIKSFERVAGELQNFKRVLIDLPPFGKSGIPVEFNIFTYADMVIELLKSLKIKSASFITHSFGARIASIIAAQKPDMVEKLVITSGAGLKPRRGIGYKAKVLKAKLYKKFNIQKDIGSADYKALSPNMKKVFKNVVNTHLEEHVKNIQAPTLLIFGENDTETPLYMAKKFKKLIKNSKLLIFENSGHFCHEENLIRYTREVGRFLEE